MIIEEIQKDGMLYRKAFELRHMLFFAPHGLPREIVNDEAENKSTHMAISDDSKLIAYGRITELESGCFQISQMVVCPKFQSQGYGTQLLNAIVRIAKNKGAKKIVLNARTTAIGLYRKQGFREVGAVFNSDCTGVPHIKMVYNENT